ncbi:unnamed protein product, partial [Heterotrigona itama]
ARTCHPYRNPLFAKNETRIFARGGDLNNKRATNVGSLRKKAGNFQSVICVSRRGRVLRRTRVCVPEKVFVSRARVLGANVIIISGIMILFSYFISLVNIAKIDKLKFRYIYLLIYDMYFHEDKYHSLNLLLFCHLFIISISADSNSSNVSNRSPIFLHLVFSLFIPF